MNKGPMGIEHPGILDAFAYDDRRDTLVLAMYETRPWNESPAQLLQLQDKLNAYVSFILDGEMQESFPQFGNTPVEIQLRTWHEPDALALSFLDQAKEQLELQQIKLEIILIRPDEGSSDDCGCTHGPCCK